MINNSKTLYKEIDYTTGDIVLTILFFIAIGLVFPTTHIYRLTVIDGKYVLGVIIAGIIIALVVLPLLVKSTYHRIWNLFIKAFIGGSIFFFGLLFLNQQFAKTASQTANLPILYKGTLARGKSGSCSQPYVIVDFDGLEKQFVFYCDEAAIVKHATTVALTYSTGGFGFAVIRERRLMQ